MKINLDGLHTIETIHRRGGFSAAAEELGRNISALSATVQKLEQDLGFPLFTRHGGRPELTPAGAHIVAEGRFILRAMADLEERMRLVGKGYEARLRIALDGLLPVQPLLDLAHRFYAITEHSRTDVSIGCGAPRGAWDLVFRRADLAVGASRRDISGHPGHHLRPIGTMDFAFAASPSHPLAARGGVVPVHELRAHRLVVVSHSAIDLSLLEGSGLGQPTLAAPSLAAKLAVLKSGLAAGFLPSGVAARCVDEGSLVELQVDRPPCREYLYVAWYERPEGKAFQWWLQQLDRADLLERWLTGYAQDLKPAMTPA